MDSCSFIFFLAVESLFNEDFNDGTLDQLFISNDPIFLLIIVKVLFSLDDNWIPILLASMIGVIFLIYLLHLFTQ